MLKFSPSQMRAVRQAAGIPRSKLALEVGRDTDTIRAYERGRWSPPLHVAAQIAAVLGVSLEALCENGDHRG